MTNMVLLFPAAICLAGSLMFATTARLEAECDAPAEAISCAIVAAVCAASAVIAFLFAIA